MSDSIIGTKSELPAYSPPAEPLTHSFELTDKHGHVWLILKVRSATHESSEEIAHLVEGKPVEGTVALDLKEHKSIKSVSVSVFGELVNRPNIRFSFASATQEVYSQEHGNLLGSYSWPFSLQLPKTIELEDEDGVKKSYRLPSHTYTRWGRSDITYRVTARVAYHHSLLYPDEAVSANVGFIPLIRPSEPSSLRRQAYEQQTQIPGPDVDPEGWQVLAPVTFRGKLPDHRHVEVDYILALAKPLSYTRGSVIPLHLTVRSADPHALSLLSTPIAPLVRLRRILHDNYDAGGFVNSGDYTDEDRHLTDLKPLHMLKFENLVGYVNKAVWWPVPSITDSNSQPDSAKTLQGELHLAAGEHPNAHLGLYKYFHDVALFNPSAPGFVPETKKADPWQTVEVEVATMHPHGPRAIAHSPPTYEEDAKPQENRDTTFNVFKGHDFEV